MTSPKRLWLVEGAVALANGRLQLWITDLIKHHKIGLLIHEAVCGIAEAPHWIDNGGDVLILVIRQESLLQTLLVEDPLFSLQCCSQRVVKALLIGELHEVQTTCSICDGVIDLLVVEVWILQVPQNKIFPELKGDAQGPCSLKQFRGVQLP